jgi:hypothetical protein
MEHGIGDVGVGLFVSKLKVQRPSKHDPSACTYTIKNVRLSGRLPLPTRRHRGK